jgi:hypothetical protein
MMSRKGGNDIIKLEASKEGKNLWVPDIKLQFRKVFQGKCPEQNALSKSADDSATLRTELIF